MFSLYLFLFFFFFNDTATTEIYTLSLHDALPISAICTGRQASGISASIKPGYVSPHTKECMQPMDALMPLDRKSTRLNSSHGYISYAVFCLKKKKKLTRKNTRSRHKSAPLYHIYV